MVKSLIDDSITYIGTNTVDENDFGYDAVQFDIELFPNMMAGVALGNRAFYIYRFILLKMMQLSNR
jgi:hypothetical protein